jgi:small-conductance mechanosensitive channel
MSAPSLNAPEKPLKLPQFGLRTLFLIVAVCGAFFAVFGAIGWLASFGLLVVLTIVCLHVLGNVLGRSLREQASSDAEENNEIAKTRPTSVKPHVALAKSRLFEHTPIGWTMRIFCVLGTLAGAALGSMALVDFTGATGMGIVVGAVSCGVLGAFFGFLIGSFLEMFLRAWWQAASEPKPANPPLASAPSVPNSLLQMEFPVPAAGQSDVQ